MPPIRPWLSPPIRRRVRPNSNLSKAIKYAGFDVDLWAAIAKEPKLDYTLGKLSLTSAALSRRCKPKNIDLSPVGITPSLPTSVKKRFDFSDGYYKSGLLVMVNAINNDIKDVKDLNGKVVAVKIRYRLIADYAKSQYQNQRFASVPEHR
ncbi:transporter substrate-binding domain-containing protein [Klebsiella pneumoniae]|nr:transporter substrate-binding domain-containing protein [Klebsiella pneumoniae]